jgi:hypothetical protein
MLDLSITLPGYGALRSYRVESFRFIFNRLIKYQGTRFKHAGGTVALWGSPECAIETGLPFPFIVFGSAWIKLRKLVL